MSDAFKTELTVLGEVYTDPRERETRDGTKIRSFIVRTKRATGSDQWLPVTQFEDKFSDYVPEQGDTVQIVGSLSRRARPDRGENQFETEVMVEVLSQVEITATVSEAETVKA